MEEVLVLAQPLVLGHEQEQDPVDHPEQLAVELLRVECRLSAGPH